MTELLVVIVGAGAHRSPKMDKSQTANWAILLNTF